MAFTRPSRSSGSSQLDLQGEEQRVTKSVYHITVVVLSVGCDYHQHNMMSEFTLGPCLGAQMCLMRIINLIKSTSLMEAPSGHVWNQRREYK